MISNGNHVKFARSVVLAISIKEKTLLLLYFASLTEQDIEKIVEDKDSQNTKRSTKVAKELFADYVKAKKTDRTRGKERLYVEARKKDGSSYSMESLYKP